MTPSECDVILWSSVTSGLLSRLCADLRREEGEVRGRS